MNRVLYVLLSLCFISYHTNAQQVIWSENFEYHYSTNFTSPWAVQGNIGSYQWSCNVDYLIGGLCFPYTDNPSRVAGIRDGNACFTQHADSNVLLMTPVINLTGITAAALRYDSYFTAHVTNGLPETATVEVSTNGGSTWTVLKNAPISKGGIYGSQYVDLSPYAGNNIRLGFRYGDNGRDSMVGWMIDNLSVFVPEQSDMAFINADPLDSLTGYALLGDSLLLSGRVMNKGATPVTAYSISYRLDNGTVYTDAFSGVTLLPFDTASFQLSRRAVMAAIGKHIVSMWVHAAGDVNTVNDSAKSVLYGAAFIPRKLTVLEAGTGTWYPFAPQQYIILNNLKVSDYPIAEVAVHDQDPMLQDIPYRDYILHMRSNNVPFFTFDRRDNIVGNRFVMVVNPQPTRIFSLFTETDFGTLLEVNSKHFGFASLTAQADMSGGNNLAVNVSVTPAINLSGDYRLALIITEDSMHGTATGWEQKNYFANNLFGPMGGYESKPNPVPASSMIYNDVAHSATPSADGTGASLPASMLANTPYSRSLYAPVNSAWTLRHLHALVLLLKGNDGSVLNAVSVPVFPLGNTNVHSNNLFAAVYPNPASTSADVLLQVDKAEEGVLAVTDITGKVLLNKSLSLTAGQNIVPFRTDGWAAGIYFITVKLASKQSITMKLTVLNH